MTTLHDQVKVEVERRLALARSYLDACGDSHGWCGDECEEFQREHDGADAIRRHEAALRVLERHQLATYGGAPLLCYDECQCIAPYPCDDLRDLAASYGIPIDDQEQP